MQGTLYDQLGGEAKLRQIIDTFIFSSAMRIGSGLRRWSCNSRPVS
jgi:hypothetical protein